MYGYMTEMKNSEHLKSIAMSDPKYLSGKGKVIDNDKPVEGLKGKFVSEPKDYSVPFSISKGGISSPLCVYCTVSNTPCLRC